jgi:TonB family protein
MPRYPAALAAAGIEGKVAVEFVIDSAGKVEGGSIRVLESTHQAFEAAAREAMTAATFHPARLSNPPPAVHGRAGDSRRRRHEGTF